MNLLITRPAAALAVAACLFLAIPKVAGSPMRALPLRVLVYTGPNAAQSPVTPDGVAALRRVAEDKGWTVATTASADPFTDANLQSYDVVVWLNTGDVVLKPEQEAAYERFHRSGKGTVGVHTGLIDARREEWPWLRRLAPSVRVSQPAVRTITVLNYEHNHPAACMIPMMWRHADEWFHYQPNPAPDAHILLYAWDSEFANPVSWYKEFDGGRYFYTGLGATHDDYASDKQFLAHLAGGIEWAGGRASNPVVRVSDGEALIFREFDGKRPNGQWAPQAPSPAFRYEVTPNALTMSDSSSISLLNRHIVRHGVAIDPRRPYAVEGKFSLKGPIDRKPHSFCVNVNVAPTDDDSRNVSCWSLNVHVLGGGKSVTRLMGFMDGGFAQIGEIDNAWGEPDVEYSFRLYVNADLHGLYQDKLLSFVVSKGESTLEKFQVDYSAFPYQPDRTKPVTIGFNGHGTAWEVKDLNVYYLDVFSAAKDRR